MVMSRYGKRAIRFVSDWRNGLVLIASLFIVVVLFTVIDASRSREQALDVANAEVARSNDARQAASSRITQLQGQIVELTKQYANARDREGQATNTAQALEQQVRILGVVPVVTVQGYDDVDLPDTVKQCLKGGN